MGCKSTLTRVREGRGEENTNPPPSKPPILVYRGEGAGGVCTCLHRGIESGVGHNYRSTTFRRQQVWQHGGVHSRWHGPGGTVWHCCLPVARTGTVLGGPHQCHIRPQPKPATASHSHSQSHMEQRRPTAFKCLQLPRDYAERTPGVRGDEPCQAEIFKARSPQRHYIKAPQWQL